MSSLEFSIGIAFWLCVGGVAYTYLGYPVLVGVFASIFGRQRIPPACSDTATPSVSILIIAHNEEDAIGARIENALALDYPQERLEIIVASDGSSDRTAALAKSFHDSRVRVIDFPYRRGKAAVLNAVIPTLEADVVALSDANTAMAPSAIRHVVRWFADEQVGVVVGRLVLSDPTTGRNVDSQYWKYETFLKRMDARLNALVGANGAIYALRQSMFVSMPADTLVDDLVLPLLVRLKHGGDIVYDPSIVAHEETPAHFPAEFKRRRRIGAGGFRSLATLWPLLSPEKGWIAFTFGSHKVLRWVCPFLLGGALLLNVLLLEHTVYQLTLSSQVAFYLAAAAGAVAPGSGTMPRVLRLVTLFTSMHAALFAGFWQWLHGIRDGTWERTARADRSSIAIAARDGATRLSGADSPIRVVHLVIALDIGGLEMVVANLARHLGRRFQLHVICLEGLGPIATRFQYAGVPVECIGSPETSIAHSVLRLRRRLKRLRPDVIHTHNEKAHIRGALATLGLWRGPALVHTRHGRTRATRLAAIANRLAVWRSAFMVSVSEDASGISRAEGARSSRVRVIRNGVDVTPDDNITARDEARSRVVAIGRLVPVKDFATLLRAARKVADIHPAFHLDVVGDGSSRAALESLQRELRLERQVTFHGASANVNAFLSRARLFVQSSLSEGISLTLLEAMAVGVPIVATRVGGTPEVVHQGVTGLLVAPRDPDALAAAMLTVLRNEPLARRMSAAARNRVERSFSLRQMAASYEALYEEAVTRPAA